MRMSRRCPQVECVLGEAAAMQSQRMGAVLAGRQKGVPHDASCAE